MLRRLLKHRAWRKLLGSRSAVIALGVIGVYVLIALASFFGFITLADTQLRVLPDRTPGWFGSREVNDRFMDADRLFIGRLESRMERLRSAADPADVLSELALAERRVIDAPIEEIERLLGVAVLARDGAAAALDELEDILDAELDNELAIERYLALPDASVYAGRVAELRSEIEVLRSRAPSARVRVDETMTVLESAVDALYPTPRGFGGLVYGLRTILGSDGQGRSIMMKALYSTRIAFQIGLVVAVVSVLIGTLMGAAAGFYGKWVDYAVMYVVSVLSSIPTLVLLGVLIYMFFGSPWFDNPAERPGLALVPVYCAMCLTFWISTCRVIRGEVLKIKQLEYVQAATTIGFGRLYILVRHVIPNTAHLMFINLSLLFIGAIKSEVILSFLGLGVKGQPSWGTMIGQAKEDVTRYFFWEVGTASVFMFVLVLAFNILSDALQDAFDPKHVS